MNRLTRYLTLIPALMLMILGAGCSHPDSFTITGKITDFADLPVKVIIYNSDSVKTVSTQAATGRFTLKSSSADYAIAVISSMSSGSSVRLLVRNGEKITLEGPSLDSLTIKGSKANEQIADFIAANPGTFDGIYPASSSSTLPISETAANKVIADYVDKEGTTPAAAFLLAVYYNPTLNPSQAAALINRFDSNEETRSLLASISDAVKNELNTVRSARVHSFNLPAAGDSTVKFSPSAQSYSLLAFTASDARRKELTSRLRDLSDTYPRKSLRVIEMSLCGDSATWKSFIKRDTLVNWSRILLPGGPAALQVRHLNIGQAPYYILSDSTGGQIYRGPALDAAIDSLDRRIAR